MNATLDAALNYAARGWLALPVYEPLLDGTGSCGKPRCSFIAKHPRVNGGYRAATTDAAQLAAWWAKWPNANVGIATGRRSGFIVLDVDPAATTRSTSSKPNTGPCRAPSRR